MVLSCGPEALSPLKRTDQGADRSTDLKNMLIRNLLLALAFTAPLAASAQSATPSAVYPIWGGALFHGYGGPWIGGPCGAYGYGYGCGLGLDYRTQLRRELRFQELREGDARTAPRAYPIPQQDLPPATPLSDIQPAYRDASQIRPEFRRAGDPPRQ